MVGSVEGPEYTGPIASSPVVAVVMWRGKPLYILENGRQFRMSLDLGRDSDGYRFWEIPPVPGTHATRRLKEDEDE